MHFCHAEWKKWSTEKTKQQKNGEEEELWRRQRKFLINVYFLKENFPVTILGQKLYVYKCCVCMCDTVYIFIYSDTTDILFSLSSFPSTPKKKSVFEMKKNSVYLVTKIYFSFSSPFPYSLTFFFFFFFFDDHFRCWSSLWKF